MVSTSWQHCIDCLKVELPAQQYNTWIRPLKPNIDADVLQISAPNRFILDWVKGKFLRRIEELVTESSGEPLQINLEVFDLRQQEVATPPTRAQSAIQQSSVGPLAKQIVKTATETGGLEEQQPLLEKIQKNDQQERRNMGIVIEGKLRHRGALNTENNFENFVVGSPNELAFAAAKRVAEAEMVPFNPLFLYGGVGLGKTHLMNAIAWVIQQKNPNRKVVYISAEKFMYQFIKALRSKDVMNFKQEFRSVDVLMIDDVQFISGKEHTQEEFFHTFNALVDRGCQIVLSADKSPNDLSGMEERLKSRLGWGLVTDIQPTTYELRLGILQSRVEMSGITFPDDVLEFIAQKIKSNVR